MNERSPQLDKKAFDRWIRRLLRDWGVVRVTLALTLVTIVVAVFVGFVLTNAFTGRSFREGLFIPVLIALLITPIFSWFSLSLIQRLDETEHRLSILAITDELTGLYNRRYLVRTVKAEFERAQRYGSGFSIILLDIDEFKQINDIYGHQTGDRVLQHIAEIGNREKRTVDVLARYGGDEFVFLLPNSRREGVLSFANRIRKHIYRSLLFIGGEQVQISVSMGVANYRPGTSDLESLFNAADTALYEAKLAGRNTAVFFAADE